MVILSTLGALWDSFGIYHNLYWPSLHYRRGWSCDVIQPLRVIYFLMLSIQYFNGRQILLFFTLIEYNSLLIVGFDSKQHGGTRLTSDPPLLSLQRPCGATRVFSQCTCRFIHLSKLDLICISYLHKLSHKPLISLQSPDRWDLTNDYIAPSTTTNTKIILRVPILAYPSIHTASVLSPRVIHSMCKIRASYLFAKHIPIPNILVV